MNSELTAGYGPVYLRETTDGWEVGTTDRQGLPVGTLGDAIAVMDCWMRVTGVEDCVIVHSDGTVTINSSASDEEEGD